MKKYVYKLIGPDIKGPGLSAALLRDVLDILVDGSEKAVRLVFEGRSTARGKVKPWVSAAAELRFVEIKEGSAEIVTEAAPINDVLPSDLKQLDFFVPDIDGSRTCLDLFEIGIKDALEGNLESDYYDDGLLKQYSQFKDVFNHGVETIRVTNGTAGRHSLEIGPEGLREIKKLKKKVYAPQYARIAGKLDVIGHSRRLFNLQLKDGQQIKGIAERLDLEKLKELWGKQVFVSGKVIFRPSGSVHRIEAESIDGANGNISLWSKLPKPLMKSLEKKSLRAEQGPRSGINAIFGKWPGDESEEELKSALEELS